MRLPALVLAGAAWAAPARADFLDDLRRTFQKGIPRFFGAKPKAAPATPPPNTRAKPSPGGVALSNAKLSLINNKISR